MFLNVVARCLYLNITQRILMEHNSRMKVGRPAFVAVYA
jgi:hypothetical protein